MGNSEFINDLDKVNDDIDDIDFINDLHAYEKVGEQLGDLFNKHNVKLKYGSNIMNWVDANKKLPIKSKKYLCLYKKNKGEEDEYTREAVLYFFPDSKRWENNIDVLYWLEIPDFPNELKGGI